MLSLSIVTFNNGHVIRACLESLFKFVPAETLSRVYIVDNGSKDSTLEIVREFQKNQPIEIIVNPDNKGFGAGHNQALMKTTSEFHVFCNPDIVFLNDALTPLAKILRERPDIGLLAPRVQFPDGRPQPLNRRMPTVYDLLVQRFGARLKAKTFEKRMDHYLMKDIGYDSEIDVPCLSGCFLIGRTRLLKDVGGFDEGYFLYFEDFDLSKKVQKSGHRTLYTPKAKVAHAWARGSHKKFRLTMIFAKSGMRFFSRWGWRLY